MWAEDEQMEIRKKVQQSPGLPLRDTWTIWLMNIRNESLRKLLDIQSVGPMWRWLNNEEPILNHIWMMCRKSGSPRWEDPSNKTSGSFSLLINDPKMAWVFWTDVCLMLAGESLCTDTQWMSKVYLATLTTQIRGTTVYTLKIYVHDMRQCPLRVFHFQGSKLPKIEAWYAKYPQVIRK